MEINLQLFGGRGGASGVGGHGVRTVGLDVTINGKTTHYIFSNRNGQNYYQRSFGSIPEKTPSNISAKEFEKRASSNGATVKKVNAAEVEKRRKAYLNERNRRPDYELGVGLKNNRAYTKQARINRLNTRAQRRK